jgi:hypothetical protein
MLDLLPYFSVTGRRKTMAKHAKNIALAKPGGNDRGNDE